MTSTRLFNSRLSTERTSGDGINRQRTLGSDLTGSYLAGSASVPIEPFIRLPTPEVKKSNGCSHVVIGLLLVDNYI